MEVLELPLANLSHGIVRVNIITERNNTILSWALLQDQKIEYTRVYACCGVLRRKHIYYVGKRKYSIEKVKAAPFKASSQIVDCGSIGSSLASGPVFSLCEMTKAFTNDAKSAISRCHCDHQFTGSTLQISQLLDY